MSDPLILEPEKGVPVDSTKTSLDLKVRTEAAANTVEFLEEYGLEVENNRETDEIAAKISLTYAEDPEQASKKVTDKRLSTLPPAALMTTHTILTEFGHSVVDSAVQVRHLVTNKLIEETENADPRVRIRALELLGKISDVGLFAEKSEVTVTHQSTDELKERLRKKLTRLVNPEEIEPAEIILDGEAINIDEELVLEDD